jgi:vacuolar-type H+-ATPase subunit H
MFGIATIGLILLFVLLVIVTAVLATLLVKSKREWENNEAAISKLEQEAREAQALIDSLRPYATVRDISYWAEDIRQKYQAYIKETNKYASDIVSQAQLKANDLIKESEAKADKMIQNAKENERSIIANAREEAHDKSREITREAQARLDEAYRIKDASRTQASEITADAKKSANSILDEAHEKAREIAAEALEAKKNFEIFDQGLKAIKNTINGYGNEYIVPTRSLLDNLAETYGFTQAGIDLKAIRETIRSMVKNREAATCDYVEDHRSKIAQDFITDAFNGKAASILAKAKVDNYGKLKQELIDAFSLVNLNGKSFRDARINPGYFNVRLKELEIACRLQEMRRQDAEEQRRIKEQIREEEKARKEIEKALRDAEKEEAAIQKAMQKVREQLEQANEEQRATYEAQIASLEQKWKEAEERNQRALSMAQQTKSGHVYIISNIGSFGDNVYKIGMTRRLEPTDRVRELGDASVPFAFDIHAMIWSEDAPALETQIHKTFALAQMNKVNHRKEFFKVTLQSIREEIEKAGINAKWTMAANATQYYETLSIEREIAGNPEAREAWLNRQLVLDRQSALQLIRPLDEDSDLVDEESA